MNDKFEAMLNLINKYLHETWGVGMYDYELRDLIEILRNDTRLLSPSKVAAVKYVREATKRSGQELFKLDLSNHEFERPISDFTAWATTNNMDLATGEVKVECLGLKKAKDLVEFIQLNLCHLVG